MADDFRPVADDRIVERPAPPLERYRRRGRRVMTALIAIAAVLGFGVILVYAYNKGRQDGESRVPPVIQAQEGPTKIRPDSPGGMNVPDRDKEIFSRLETEKQPDRVERLLPPPDKPMERPDPPPAAPATAEMEPAAGKMPEKMPEIMAEKIPGSMPAQNSVASAMPEREKAPAMAPSESLKLPPPPEAPPAPPKTAAPAPAPEKKVAAKTETAATTGAVDGWKVQLSSVRSESAAKGGWTVLQKKYSDLLGDLSSSVQRVTLAGGKGTYYRLQAGPLSSKTAANTLCGKLKERKQGCIVVRP